MEKEKIINLINKAETLTPQKIEKDLEPLDEFSQVQNWHKYEIDIWEIGEKIRQVIISKKSLRKDTEIIELIIKFCLNKNSKRGRQSFILLLGYKHLSKYAPQLINLIDDKYVYGQIIDTICKMQATGFEKKILPFRTDKNTWIKNTAIKYTEKYST
jgi:hypothetical protein